MPGNKRGRPRLSERVEPIYPDRLKVCSMCGREKPWRAFYPKSRHADNTVASIRSRCRLCESGVAKARWQSWLADETRLDELNAKRRAHHREKMRTDPAYAEKYRRDNREAKRYRYATDPEFRAALIARASAFNRSPRGRELERRRRARARDERRRETSQRLDITPWREWLDERLSCFENAGAMASWLGVDESHLRRWLDGGRTGVRLDTVDAALCRIGEPHLLMLLWPELYEDEDERSRDERAC